MKDKIFLASVLSYHHWHTIRTVPLFMCSSTTEKNNWN